MASSPSTSGEPLAERWSTRPSLSDSMSMLSMSSTRSAKPAMSDGQFDDGQRLGAQVQRVGLRLAKDALIKRHALQLGVVRQAFGVDRLHVISRSEGSDEQPRHTLGHQASFVVPDKRLAVVFAAIAYPQDAAELERLPAITAQSA